MSMIEIFKDTLQEGMEIAACKEYASKYKVTLSYKGMIGNCELGKTCAPKQEKSFCRKAIDTIVSGMYINAGNLEEAKAWLEGQRWNVNTDKKKIRISFRVYDKDGNDVTDKNDWYIGIDGILYFETTDIDCPLMEAGEYRYEIETQ